MKAAAKKLTSLEIKIMAVNALQEHAKRILAHEIAGFKKLIGVDAFKVDGSMKAKYHFDKMERVSQKFGENWLSVDYYRDKTDSSIRISIKVCINGGSYEVTPSTAFCIYHEESYYIANIVDGKIEAKNLDLKFLDQKFTVASLQKLQKQAEQAAEAYNKAKSAIDHRFRQVLDIGYIH